MYTIEARWTFSIEYYSYYINLGICFVCSAKEKMTHTHKKNTQTIEYRIIRAGALFVCALSFSIVYVVYCTIHTKSRSLARNQPSLFCVRLVSCFVFIINSPKMSCDPIHHDPVPGINSTLNSRRQSQQFGNEVVATYRALYLDYVNAVVAICLLAIGKKITLTDENSCFETIHLIPFHPLQLPRSCQSFVGFLFHPNPGRLLPWTRSVAAVATLELFFSHCCRFIECRSNCGWLFRGSFVTRQS